MKFQPKMVITGWEEQISTTAEANEHSSRHGTLLIYIRAMLWRKFHLNKHRFSTCSQSALALHLAAAAVWERFCPESRRLHVEWKKNIILFLIKDAANICKNSKAVGKWVCVLAKLGKTEKIKLRTLAWHHHIINIDSPPDDTLEIVAYVNVINSDDVAMP